MSGNDHTPVNFNLEEGPPLPREAFSEIWKASISFHLASLFHCATSVWSQGSVKSDLAGFLIRRLDEARSKKPAANLCSSYRV